MEAISEAKDSKRQGLGTQTINVVAEAEDLPICWICLDGPHPEKPLIHPCRCPSFCHAACIARWQLQSAGTRREKYCDFCSCQLPDWKSILTPCGGAGAPAVMNVNFDNKTYSFQVSPGADGYKQFTEAIRKAFHLPDDSELNITFTCDEPSSAGALLTLSGPGAYDAAVHCASVSAARRVVTSDQQQPQQVIPGTCTAPGSSNTTSPGSAMTTSSGPATLLPPPVNTHPISSHQISRSNSSSDYSLSGGGNSRRSSSSGSGLYDMYDEAAGSSSSSGASGSSSEGPSSPAGPFSGSQAGGGGGESVEVEVEQEDGSSSDGSARSSHSSSSSSGRRGTGLGRKLRNAISDLLVIR